MTRTTKIVVGSWLISAPALVGCVDKENQGGAASATDGVGITSASLGESADPGDTGDDTSTQPTDGGGTAGDSGAGGTGSQDTDSTPGGTGGTESDTMGAVPSGCQKIDLLFVIDNSSTMGAEQQSLISAFPTFFQSVQNTLGVADYHIMAVAADDGKVLGNNAKCKNKECTCGPAPGCCQNVCNGNIADTCNGLVCENLAISECAFMFGAGRDFHTDGTACNLEAGRRYMTSTQPDIAGTFACIASVGTYDTIGDKKPMRAAVEAVSSAHNGPGGCNDGFLRDDALLVLVFVTDKDDANAGKASGSPGEPKDWYDAIVAAKGGDPNKVVVLGLVGDGNLPAGVCAPEDEPDMAAQIGAPAPRLQEFVGMFPHSAIGSVCAPDYTPFLADAVAIVDQACDALPPGP